MNDFKNAQKMVNVPLMQVGDVIEAPFQFVKTTVSEDWLDYNGHMNECMYLFVASLGYEGFAKYVGLTPEWAKQNGSYFTVENHNVYIDECTLGDKLYVTTQLIDADEKRVHLLHQIYKENNDSEDSNALVFTSEQLNVYVNPISRRVEPAHSDIWQRIQKIYEAHKDMPKAYSGRVVGIRRKS